MLFLCRLDRVPLGTTLGPICYWDRTFCTHRSRNKSQCHECRICFGYLLKSNVRSNKEIGLEFGISARKWRILFLAMVFSEVEQAYLPGLLNSNRRSSAIRCALHLEMTFPANCRCSLGLVGLSTKLGKTVRVYRFVWSKHFIVDGCLITMLTAKLKYRNLYLTLWI